MLFETVKNLFMELEKRTSKNCLNWKIMEQMFGTLERFIKLLDFCLKLKIREKIWIIFFINPPKISDNIYRFQRLLTFWRGFSKRIQIYTKISKIQQKNILNFNNLFFSHSKNLKKNFRSFRDEIIIIKFICHIFTIKFDLFARCNSFKIIPFFFFKDLRFWTNLIKI